MGGIGSGGRNGLSDEEKKRRGTFRNEGSEEARLERAAAKVVTGPWLETIPDPDLTLAEFGKNKYFELARALHSQNKLTLVTKMRAEFAASMFEKIKILGDQKKSPSASDMQQLQRALDALGIAENAPPLTRPEGHVNKFAACGFSNRRNATARLRIAAAAGS